MENVPSVVCLMSGFLSSHHTAEAPRWSGQQPSAGHCREKTLSFSTCITIISLHAECNADAKHSDESPSELYRKLTCAWMEDFYLTHHCCCQTMLDHIMFINYGAGAVLVKCFAFVTLNVTSCMFLSMITQDVLFYRLLSVTTTSLFVQCL